MAGLTDLAERYAAAYEAREAAARALDEAKKVQQRAERALIDALTDSDLGSVTTSDGLRVAMTRKTRYCCLAEHREQLIETLREDGLEGLLTVNPASLNRAMTELAEQYGGELPERYSYISQYDDIKLGKPSRKK